MKFQLKFTTLSFAFLFFSTQCKGGDFSEWWHITPCKNQLANENWNDQERKLYICSENRSYVNKNGSHVLEFIGKWYFYKSHVVGTLDSNHVSKFFIINESTCNVSLFDDLITFKTAIKHEGLKPILWTRWYDANWGFFITGDGYGGIWDFFFFRGTWLFFPLILIILCYLLWNFGRRRWARITCILIIVATCIRIVLDCYPQSI